MWWIGVRSSASLTVCGIVAHVCNDATLQLAKVALHNQLPTLSLGHLGHPGTTTLLIGYYDAWMSYQIVPFLSSYYPAINHIANRITRVAIATPIHSMIASRIMMAFSNRMVRGSPAQAACDAGVGLDPSLHRTPLAIALLECGSRVYPASAFRNGLVPS